jgi:fibronectin-binding autotransporter adhesin
MSLPVPHSVSLDVQPMGRSRCFVLRRACLIALTAVLGLHAEEKQSVVSLTLPNIWNAPATWSSVGEPGAGDDVSIGDTVDNPATFELQNAPIIYTTLLPESTILGNLKINATLVSYPGTWVAAGPAPVVISEVPGFLSRGIHQAGFTLRTTNEIYGDDKSGYFLQTGGLHTVENDVTLGRLDTGFGLYLIDAPVDGVFRVRRDLIVGDAGKGLLQQVLGEVIVQRDLWLGKSASGTGHALIAGPLQVWGDLNVAGAGVGTLDLGLGSYVISGDANIGLEAGSVGVLQALPSALAEVTGETRVGVAGQGRLSVDGAGASFQTGRLTVGAQDTGDGHAVASAGGLLEVGTDLFVGDEGTGKLSLQLGGQVQVDHNLVAGRSADSDGTFEFVGPTLTINTLFVANDMVLGDRGSATVTGGRADVTVGGNLIMAQESGSSVSVNLGATPDEYGSFLTVDGAMRVGVVGGASVELGGFTTAAVDGGVTVAEEATSTSSLRLDFHSTLQAGSVRVGLAGQAEVEVDDSSILTSLGDLTMAESTGSVANGSVGASSYLGVGGTARIGMAGLAAMTVNVSSGLNDYGVGISEDLQLGVGGTGSVDLQVGHFDVGGTVTIGQGGTGTWTQSGGTAVFSGTVDLGDASAGSGLLALSGGTLSALSLNLLNTGTLSLTGGSMNLGSLQLLGGTLSNSGGQLTVGDLYLGGGSITGDIRTTGTTTVDPTVSGLNGQLDNGGTFALDQPFSPSGGFRNSGTTVITDGGVLTTPVVQIDSGDLILESGGVIDVDALHNLGGDFTMKPGSWLFTDLFNNDGGGSDIEGGHLTIRDILNVEHGLVEIASGTEFDSKYITVGSGGSLYLGPGVWNPPAGSRLAIAAGGIVSFNASSPTAHQLLPEQVVVIGDGVQTTSLEGDGAWHLKAGTPMLLSRAALNGGGTLTIDPGAQLDIVGNGASLSRDIFNHGLIRLNATDAAFFVGGTSTLTNQSDGTLRVLDEPIHLTTANYNALRATGLNLINAGTMTIGALTPQTGNAALPWFWLDQTFTNTGSLSLLQSATFTVEDAFSNSGAITLASGSQLSALGGGTMQGTLALGPEATSFAVFRGVTVHDTGATFTGSGGFVSIEGGTLHTAAGEYAPTVNLELLASPTLPDATGLAVGNGRWLRIAGSVPALPVRVASGGTFELMGGTNTNAIAVEHGGAMRLGDSYGNSTNHTRPDEPNVLNAVAGQPGRGDIDNHGTLTVVPGSVTGTGRVLNRADGVMEAISNSGTLAQEMLLGVINEGLLTLWTRDERAPYGENLDGIRFGNITNSGTTVLKATEVSADPYDDVSVRIGDYVQNGGTTTLETAGAGTQYLPYVQADSFSILGGTVNATGRLVSPTIENAGVFQVGAAGLELTGTFNNNSGGDLRLTGNLSTTGGFALNSGSRLLLNGATAGISLYSSPLFAGDFTTPAGATIELRDRSLTSGATMTTQGTLIVGSGATMTRTGGYLAGSGEVRVASGGSLILRGSFDGSGGGPITIEAGGSLSMPSRDYGIFRFHNRTVTNDGTVTHSVNSLSFNAGTTITNNGTWSVALPGVGDVGGYITEGGQTQGGSFINNGTFNQNGANDLYFNNGPAFTNHGTVNVNSGLLRIQSQGTFAGTSVVNVASGATLELRDGTANIQSGARFQGAGTLSLGDAGTHNLNGDIHAANASFWGGTLNGTHTLHGTWNKSGTGGSMATAGTTTIASDGTWNFLASTNLRGRTFVNQGTVNQGTLNDTNGRLELSPATLIQNHGTWNALSQGDMIVSQNSPQGGLFVNFGTFNKNGTGTLTVSSGYGGPGFTNHGTINVNTGTLTLNYATTFSGTSVANIASGATLYMEDGTNTVQSGARFQGAGTVTFGSGQHILNGDIHADHASIGGGTLQGTHTLHGSWVLNYYPNIATAGTTTIASDGSWRFEAAGNNNLSNRTFINDGAVTHTGGNLVLNAATTIRNHGTWTESSGYPISSTGHLQGLIENTGTFIKTGANTVGIDHGSGPAFSNTGTVDVQQGTLQLNHKLAQHSGSTLTGGTWIVRSGATLREDYTTSYTINQADVTLHGTGDFSPLNTLTTNAGTLRLLDGKAFSTSSAFTNSGTLVVGTGSSFGTTSTFANSGTLTIAGAFSSAALTNTGTLGGAGTLTGSLVSAGILAPGSSPGLLTVTGNLTLQSTSDLLMELGGLTEGVTYDAIDVGGTLAFEGDLVVTLLNAFTPASGATFNLFDATTFTGSFATVSLPTLTAGLTWDATALYTTGVLSVTGTAIPEPSTYAALAGVAALGLAAWLRRMR